MGALFFVVGSAVGAALAWLIGRRERSRSTIAVLSGVAGGILGLMMSASHEIASPATEAGLGLLGTAVPLTLCISRGDSAAQMPAAARHLAAGLAPALICGMSCAIVGYVAVEGVRDVGVKERESRATEHPIVMPVGEPQPVHPRGR